METDVIILVGVVVFFVILVTIGVVWMYSQKSTPTPATTGTSVTPSPTPVTPRPSPTPTPVTPAPSPTPRYYLKDKGNYFFIANGSDGIYRTYATGSGSVLNPAIFTKIGSENYAIKSIKSNYCTDQGDNDFTCNAATIGPSETFKIEKLSGTSVALKNNFGKYCNFRRCIDTNPVLNFTMTTKPPIGFEIIDGKLYYSGILYSSWSYVNTRNGQIKFLENGNIEYKSNSGQVTEYIPSIVDDNKLKGIASDGKIIILKQDEITREIIEEFS